tara:strand:+ start:75 stop:443 length:369 start_codon:yes stop_codon:yes gene_type:complete
MFDQCLEGDFTEANRALAFAAKKKAKDSKSRATKAEEGRQATAAYHLDGIEEGTTSAILEPQRWIPLAGAIDCFDIHTHGDGERSHGNSTAESASSFSKSVKHATKRSGKQTRQKSSWNKGQ